MSRRGGAASVELIEEAARLICDDGYTDYRLAKLKAAERLGLGRSPHYPENQQIEAAVLERQALFGGAEYLEHLRRMRVTALRAMKLLGGFAPRLSGSVVTGAIGFGHRVQIHVEADQPEAVEMLLHDRRVRFEQDERRYRLADGRDQQVSLLCIEADGIGIDIAVFDPGTQRNPPLSPIDGRPARRLLADQVQGLLDAAPDSRA